MKKYIIASISLLVILTIMAYALHNSRMTAIGAGIKAYLKGIAHDGPYLVKEEDRSPENLLRCIGGNSNIEQLYVVPNGAEGLEVMPGIATHLAMSHRNGLSSNGIAVRVNDTSISIITAFGSSLDR